MDWLPKGLLDVSPSWDDADHELVLSGQGINPSAQEFTMPPPPKPCVRLALAISLARLVASTPSKRLELGLVPLLDVYRVVEEALLRRVGSCVS